MTRLSVLFAFALSGCTLGPDFKLPFLNLPKDYPEPHVAAADESVLIGPPAAAQSYLSMDAVLNAAAGTGADAIHPGYGFLSENAAFAEVCEVSGLTFIGPPSHAIRLMGDKARARRAMRDAGVPILPGTEDALDSFADAKKAADEKRGADERNALRRERSAQSTDPIGIFQSEAEMKPGRQLAWCAAHAIPEPNDREDLQSVIEATLSGERDAQA